MKKIKTKQNSTVRNPLLVVGLILLLVLSIYAFNMFKSGLNNQKAFSLEVTAPEGYTMSSCSDYPTLGDNVEINEPQDRASAYIVKGDTKILISAYNKNMDRGDEERLFCTRFLDSGTWIGEGEVLRVYEIDIMGQDYKVFDYLDGSRVYGTIDYSYIDEEFSPNSGTSICPDDDTCIFIRFVVTKEEYEDEFEEIKSAIESIVIKYQ